MTKYLNYKVVRDIFMGVKELCDAALKTLVLERGRDVKHIVDYPTASKAPWEFEFRGTVPIEKRAGYQFGRF
ncbi:MAG: hypothetical protein IPI77_17470, partial [Saprospiraceae bacterium]|nr:hypothetical protein [Saprospiraceae bacterium]